jgi:hypothetical protein
MADEVTQDRRSFKFPAGTSVLVTIIMIVGGGLVTAGRVSSRFDNLDARIVTIEANYVPARIHLERDRMRDEQIKEIQDHATDTKAQIQRIEDKLDRILDERRMNGEGRTR